MSLTTSQLSELKIFILADPTLSAYAAQNAVGPIVSLLNTAADPAFIVWKTFVSQDEIMKNGFDWVQVDNLTVGKARIWEWLFDNQQKSINPSKANVRAGIDEAWKGTAAMLAVRAAVYVHCKRAATVAEKLFSTGTGSDASPATTDLTSQVTDYDVEQALKT